MSLHPVSQGNISSFSQGGTKGPEWSSFGSGQEGRQLLAGERYEELDRRQTYYDATQHDWKKFDFDGRPWSPRDAANPIMGMEKSAWYVPLRQRRPTAPVRLGKVIVDSFTNMMFGENRFPDIQVAGDEDSDDFGKTMARVGKLPLAMIRARTLGGSVGTVGLSWCFYKGKPRYDVHNGKNLYVHAWEDRALLIPRHVTEVYRYFRPEWDGAKRRFVNRYYWFRRDWTEDWDYVFKPAPYDPNIDPFWEPDMERSHNHNDGRIHIEWIQNMPREEIDGAPDYDGLYDTFDTMDIIASVVAKGASLSLDPTLLLKLDPDLVSRMGIRRGSDQALIVGEKGDASYMTVDAAFIDAGMKLIQELRRSALETAQCVVPDPATIAAQGVSSVAIKAMYSPMLARVDVLQEQYGTALERIIDFQLTVARALVGSSITVVDAETGTETEAELTIELPPKVEKRPVVDPATGMPAVDPATGVQLPDVAVRIPRVPGVGGEVNLRWPPRFAPTPDDQLKTATMLQMATGGKAFTSKRTAVEIQAQSLGIDAAEEWARVDAQHGQEQDDQAAMFPPGVGGEVDEPNQLPDGATPRGAQDASGTGGGAGDVEPIPGATGPIQGPPKGV